jgi:hypothetical protein
MRVEDLQSKAWGWLIRLHDYALAEALHACIAPAGIATDRRAFCSAHRAGISGQHSPDDAAGRLAQ